MSALRDADGNARFPTGRKHVGLDEALKALDQIALPADIPGGYVGPDNIEQGIELARQALLGLAGIEIPARLTEADEIELIGMLNGGELSLSDIMDADGASPGSKL